MKNNLSILFIEDSKTDVELMQNKLKKAGIFFESTVIETKSAFVNFLEIRIPDLILCDFKLPSFDAETALKIRNERCPYTPFIIVTGTLVDEMAIDFLKIGATDYILKNNLQRLVPSIKRAIKELDDEKELAKAQKMVIESEKRYRELFENTSDLISIISNVGGFVLVNQAWETSLGYTPKEISNFNSMDIIHKNSREKYVAVFNRALTREKIRGIELTLMAKDGREVIIETNFFPKIESGKVIYVQGIFRDITDKKRLEKELMHAMKMDAIGRLAGGIAHDFNNILGAIEGYASMILNTVGGTSPIRPDLEEIRKSVQRATILTRQLLAFSRKQNLQKRITNVNKIIINLEKMIKRIIGEDIKFTTELEKNLPNSEIDPGQIEQVMINMMVNSRQAMPEGGDILIKTESLLIGKEDCRARICPEHARFVAISVQDSGTGMSGKTLEHLFEPFFTTKEKGTGLGLSISYGIIKQHNGWIGVESEIDRGTTFTIYLPTTEQETTNGREPAVSGEDNLEGRGEKIFVIEDDEDLRKLAARGLKQHGYQVFESSCGEEASEIFEKENGNFDVIFSDMVLPDRKGTALLEDFLNINPRLKVIFTSGYGEIDKLNLELIRQKGFAFIQKPYSMENLLKVFKEVLAKTKIT